MERGGGVWWWGVKGGGGGQDVGPWNGYGWILRETNFPESPYPLLPVPNKPRGFCGH